MVMLHTLRRKWNWMLAGACCLVGGFALVDAAYQGLVYGTVRPVPGLSSLHRLYCKLAADVSCVDLPSRGISWSAHPVLFVVNLAILLPAMTILAGVVALSLWGWRTEQRNLNRRDSRPLMDTAIRESMKR
jgi:hypothetical protein